MGMVAILNLLKPQEEFERVRAWAIHHTGPALSDLSYANPYDGPVASAKAVLREALERNGLLDLQYTPYGGSTRARRLIAADLAGRTGLPFRWRNVVLTPGAMAALHIAFRLVKIDTATQEEIIVPTPCWIDYPLYAVERGLTPVLVSLREPDFRLDFDAIRAAITPRTRGLILSQPANPTGILYSAGELKRLAEILTDAGGLCGSKPMLIADETHRDIVFQPRAFTSALAFYDNTIIIYSFGKSRFMQGQRLGYLAVSPESTACDEHSGAAQRLCRVMGFCTPTSLMQIAVGGLLQMTADVSAIARRSLHVASTLDSLGYEVVTPEGTFFVYVRTPEADDFKFTTRLAERGVLVLPSTVFHHKGYVRLSVTGSDKMIAKALAVFAEPPFCEG